jgi:hypothetical protein
VNKQINELNQNIVVIDKITTAMLQAQTFEQFGDAIEKHETAMSLP